MYWIGFEIGQVLTIDYFISYTSGYIVHVSILIVLCSLAYHSDNAIYIVTLLPPVLITFVF